MFNCKFPDDGSTGRSILECARDAIYIHMCITIWFLFYIIAVKGDCGHEPVETRESCYFILFQSCSAVVNECLDQGSSIIKSTNRR